MSDEMVEIRVNGEVVAEALIEQELQMLRERYVDEIGPGELAKKQEKVESDARENAVERILLMQQARKAIDPVRAEELDARFAALKDQHGGEEAFHERFDLQPEDEAKIKADIEDGVRLEKYFEEICKDVPRPTEAEAQAYYEEHTEEFTMPEMVHATHMVQHPSEACPPEKIYADLLNVRERLLAGEGFEDLLAEFSHCQDGGEDLGFFARGQMVQSFEDVAFATPAGEFSDIFQSEFGYHILKVYDRKPARVRGFDEVRYDIEGKLFGERKNEAIGGVADGLRADADIENLEIVED